MKTRLLLPGILGLVVLSIGIVVWMTSGTHPFSTLEANQIESVHVRMIPPSIQYELSNEKAEEFCKLLNDVVTYRTFSPEPMTGQFVEFTVQMQNGEIHTIQPFANIITIDDVTYQTAYDPSEALNHFANQNIPDSFTHS
ncbi:hypothetical protein [uncultured Ruthenibacterium sp.]|uniref:hypothetical protein n=1 Tax=uncultured Ruthenibacterium sp. TaxID=1905347 RepID=UPI00349E7B0D